MMYGTSNEGTGLRLSRSVPVLLVMLGAFVALLAIGSSTAKAETVGFEFDRGVINLGGEEGTWATLIDPTIPDPPATLKSEVAGDGTLTAPPEEFNFPPKRIEDLATGNSLLPFVDANILITAEGPITGNFDTATGESEVSIPADVFITVYSAGSPSSVARCRVDGFPLNLSTEAFQLDDPGDPAADPPRPPATYNSSPFAAPAGAGEGAMIATWTGLPPADAEGGSLASIVCPALDDLIGGPGATWLDGIAGTDVIPPPPGPPTVAPKITATPAASTDSTSAEFKFEQGDNETANITGFVCKLDAGAFEPCDSGTKAYSGLAVGNHTFEVKAKNTGGEGPGATKAWTITGAVDPGKPKLGGLKISPKSKTVKKGKKATFTVKVTNSGDAAATGVKICLKAPKKFIGGAKCMSQGSLAAGKSATKKFKVTVKKKAKKGKKITLSVKASAAGTSASGKATVKVK